MNSRFLATALALATLVSPANAQSPAPAGGRWWSHVRELADDKYEGRLTGTPGYDRAAAYVVAQYKALGLRAGAGDGFLQTVRFVEQSVDMDASRATLSGAGGDRMLAVGDELLLGTRAIQRDVKDAPLVFIGYGLHLPEAGYDDLAGQDLRGKVVVYLNGGPKNLSGASKGHARAAAFGPALERSGAIGSIALANPKSSDIPWARQRLLAQAPGMMLADPALRNVTQPSFSASLDPERAEALFKPAGRSFADLLALADKGEPLPRFDLQQRLTATVAAKTREITSTNVVGLLPGRDPRLRAEHVVLTGHLDHIGIGPAIDGDRIYNGAMDNASGVASLIETARVLTRRPPARSVIFLAVTAEERGLLGSRYFGARPTVPAASLVANINMDMFMPLFPMRKLVAYGEGESTLGPVAAATAKAHGAEVVPDPAPDRNIFIRSDQYSFVREGIPALMLTFEPSTDADKALVADFFKRRYHAPADDLSQPIDRAAAAKFNLYLADFITRVANAPERPQWNANSVFGRSAPASAAVGR